MTKVILAHDIAQIDVPSGRRHGGNMPGQVFDMEPADAAAVVGIGGTLATLAGHAARGLGYRCGSCGFGSYLRRCGRCGKECERE